MGRPAAGAAALSAANTCVHPCGVAAPLLVSAGRGPGGALCLGGPGGSGHADRPAHRLPAVPALKKPQIPPRRDLLRGLFLFLLGYIVFLCYEMQKNAKNFVDSYIDISLTAR